MSNQKELQEEARRLFEQKVSQKNIAAQLGVSVQTVASWKNKYQWVRPTAPIKLATIRHHAVDIATRVAAFTMFCNHVTVPLIAKQLNVSVRTVNLWQWEDGWEERRNSRLESEVVPEWAQSLEKMLAIVYERQKRIEEQLMTLLEISTRAKQHSEPE